MFIEPDIVICFFNMVKGPQATAKIIIPTQG